MNSKFYVSYEAARLLKEKGYNEECDCAIDEDSDIHVCEYRMNQDLPEWKWSCPTKDEAIDWLEGHGIRVSITYVEEELYSYDIDNLYTNESISGFESTRLQAKNTAIIEACKLLDNKN